jgi:hypothetical protein
MLTRNFCLSDIMHACMQLNRRFVRELARVCAPGGRVLVVTWCHRVLAPGEAALKPEEQALLDRICEAYYLPAWCSVADYEKLFGEGLRVGVGRGGGGGWGVNTNIRPRALGMHNITTSGLTLPPPPPHPRLLRSRRGPRRHQDRRLVQRGRALLGRGHQVGADDAGACCVCTRACACVLAGGCKNMPPKTFAPTTRLPNIPHAGHRRPVQGRLGDDQGRAGHAADGAGARMCVACALPRHVRCLGVHARE